jgi:uncharacterized repeat protein (TIGR03803 family)
MTCRNVRRIAAVRMFALAALRATRRRSRTSIMLAALCLCASGSLPAQTFTSLFKFGSGGPPTAGLVEGTDGNLYGTTYGGGAGGGTVFKFTPTGTLTTLHSFSTAANGDLPTTLVQHSNGTFYGTTVRGGVNLYHACGG